MGGSATGVLITDECLWYCAVIVNIVDPIPERASIKLQTVLEPIGSLEAALFQPVLDGV